jgi:hypothetical protein
VECTEPFQAWVDGQPVAGPSPFETSLEPGRHFVILRVEISNRTNPELRVKLARPAGSTAQFEVVGGM